ncbi:MAG: hypothetical protein R3Y66_08565 [Rikenellaceae bacterium]
MMSGDSFTFTTHRYLKSNSLLQYFAKRGGYCRYSSHLSKCFKRHYGVTTKEFKADPHLCYAKGV